VLLSFTLTACQEDAAKRALKKARTFARDGDYAQSLKNYEWFFENALSVNQSYIGVRQSYVLAEWKSLGDKYPPALTSFLALRDKALKELRSGKGSALTFSDYQSINEHLKETDATMDLFRELHTKNPELAQKCFSFIDETLLAKNEFELFTAYAGDLSQYMEKEIESHLMMQAGLKAKSNPQLADTIKHLENRRVEKALTLIEYLNKKGDTATAEKIRKMTYETVADFRLHKVP
jgi:hypothetical protein